jgi:hypothetical protein
MEKQQRKDKVATYMERERLGGIVALRNTVNGKLLLSAETDIASYRNRFNFAVTMNSGMHLKMQSDWKLHGPQAFEFVILETLKKAETQTMLEFKNDLKALEEVVRERLEEKLY